MNTVRARLWISPEDMTPAQRALLEAMVEENPFGSPSAQALLSLAYRTPYKRVPWLMNDTLPEKRLDVPYSAVMQRAANWIIAPNPTSSFVSITSTVPLTDLRIFHATGGLIYRRTLNAETQLSVDVSQLPPGIYHITGSADQGLLTDRLIISR